MTMRPIGKARLGSLRVAAALGLLVVAIGVGAGEGEGPNPWARAESALWLGARRAEAWLAATPAAERVIWGAFAAAVVLGTGVTIGRLWVTRRRRNLPARLVPRLLDRVRDGKLDQVKGIDLCELNPSPAARIALAALRRWDRAPADMERAVGLAVRAEADRLGRHVSTLRRIAVMTPLIGLLGTLMATGRLLSGLGLGGAAPWGPQVAQGLVPLTVGVALAILALVFYDGLVGRVQRVTGDLERLGLELVDAIATLGPSHALPARTAGPRVSLASRTPHQIRVELPEPPRGLDDDD